MFEYFAYSHTGLVRENNEDTFVIDKRVFREKTVNGITNHHIFAVFDGVGGLPDGEKASFDAATLLSKSELKKCNEETIRNLLFNINSDFLKLKRAGLNYGATTIAGLCVSEETAIVFNIGDSRVYRFRSGLYLQLSKDDSLIAKRQQAFYLPRGVITNFIGQNDLLAEDIHVYLYGLGFVEGDIYIICSDGVSDFISDDEMESLLKQSQGLEEISLKMNELIFLRGARDNFTYILIRREQK